MVRVNAISFVIIFLVTINAAAQEVKDPAIHGSRSDVKVAEASTIHQGTTSGDFLTTGSRSTFLGEPCGMFLSDAFTEGIVELSGGITYEPVLLRYNLYFQQMQFIRGGDTLAFASPGELENVVLGDRNFIYSAFKNRKMLDSSYFEVISNGKCLLLKHHYIKYHFSEADTPYEEEYVYLTSLYVKKGPEPAVALRKCKKAVCCAFPDKKEEIKDFIKTNNLKMRHTEDIMLVIEYYNRISSGR